MSETKYFYMYKIVNKITGSQYVGVHETGNLDDGYMGSGKVIVRAVRKYGRDAFDKIVLEFFDTREEMYLRESEVVIEDFVKRPDVMNIAIGGSGGSMKYNQKPFVGPHTEMAKQKISERSRGKQPSKESLQKMRDNNFARRDPEKQKQHATNAGKMRWAVSDSNSGAHLEETKKKISETLKRRNRDNPQSEKTKLKQSESQRLRRIYERSLSIRKIWIYHPIDRVCKMINTSEDIPAGWLVGRKMKFD